MGTTSQDGSPPGSPSLTAAAAFKGAPSGAAGDYMRAPTGSPPRIVLTGTSPATSGIRPQTLAFGRGAPLTPPSLHQARLGNSPGQLTALRGPVEAAKATTLHLKQPSPVRAAITATEACGDGDGGAVLGAGLHSGLPHDAASRPTVALAARP